MSSKEVFVLLILIGVVVFHYLLNRRLEYRFSKQIPESGPKSKEEKD